MKEIQKGKLKDSFALLNIHEFSREEQEITRLGFEDHLCPVSGVKDHPLAGAISVFLKEEDLLCVCRFGDLLQRKSRIHCVFFVALVSEFCCCLEQYWRVCWHSLGERTFVQPGHFVSHAWNVCQGVGVETHRENLRTCCCKEPTDYLQLGFQVVGSIRGQ